MERKSTIPNETIVPRPDRGRHNEKESHRNSQQWNQVIKSKNSRHLHVCLLQQKLQATTNGDQNAKAHKRQNILNQIRNKVIRIHKDSRSGRKEAWTNSSLDESVPKRRTEAVLH